jgi:hypothetical protein
MRMKTVKKKEKILNRNLNYIDYENKKPPEISF